MADHRACSSQRLSWPAHRIVHFWTSSLTSVVYGSRTTSMRIHPQRPCNLAFLYEGSDGR